MKKIILTIFFLLSICNSVSSDTKINPINEGDIDAKINLILYESLTCGHCADFHKNIYPELKKDFIEKGLVKIEFRSFPLDMMAFNASKIAHCKNDGNSKILHFLYMNQNKWVKGSTIEEANTKIADYQTSNSDSKGMGTTMTAINIDGENLGTTPLDIKVLPSAIKIFN